MNKTTHKILAAVAALALSGGAFAQAGGGAGGGPSSVGTGAKPAMNHMNDTTSGYGTPGATNSDSGMSAGSPNSKAHKGTAMKKGSKAGVNSNTHTTDTMGNPTQATPGNNSN